LYISLILFYSIGISDHNFFLTVSALKDPRSQNTAVSKADSHKKTCAKRGSETRNFLPSKFFAETTKDNKITPDRSITEDHRLI
jgi:hypothetical protein